jgi:N,N'-diacetyllegionaminate synthase
MYRNKVFIIAEAGCNHNGRIDLAFKMVDHAKKSGADAIKFQIFDVNYLLTKSVKRAPYARKNSGNYETQFEMQKRLMLTQEEHFKIKEYCQKKNIKYLCSAFDVPSLLFLNKIKLDIFKIPSGEITNFPILKHLRDFRKPVILSTGMSNSSEILEALKFMKLPKKLITILHCNSEYPTPFKDVNLNSIIFLKNKFKTKVGFSDHTTSVEIPIAATALGITILEKHFTLNKNFDGPDHHMSLLPNQLTEMIKSIRNIESSMGTFAKKITKSEKKNKNFVRKSIVASKKINKNDVFTDDNITTKRAGLGICASKFYKIIGMKSNKSYFKDELINF